MALRSDPSEAGGPPETIVDCEARMLVCHAVCCKLDFEGMVLNQAWIDAILVNRDPYLSAVPRSMDESLNESGPRGYRRRKEQEPPGDARSGAE